MGDREGLGGEGGKVRVCCTTGLKLVDMHLGDGAGYKRGGEFSFFRLPAG